MCASACIQCKDEFSGCIFYGGKSRGITVGATTDIVAVCCTKFVLQPAAAKARYAVALMHKGAPVPLAALPRTVAALRTELELLDLQLTRQFQNCVRQPLGNCENSGAQSSGIRRALLIPDSETAHVVC